jgi:LytS/YehU family sensor histidine kinase
MAEYAARFGKAPKSVGLLIAAEYINMLILSGMIYAVAEVLCQRMRTQRAFEAAVRQQAALERQVLQSRLSAMQAQVEPRFLFDTLVDIEALYEKSPPQAAANLDRLIAFLRAALPRLRESGSTVEAEIELVRTYLDVVTALHGGRPRLEVSMAEACQQRRFYPMLLLPLVQRAVRNPSGAPPEAIEVEVGCSGAQTVIALRLALPGGCADDPELARVRERLAGLYGNAASLDCVEGAGDAIVLTLRIADEAGAGR